MNHTENFQRKHPRPLNGRLNHVFVVFPGVGKTTYALHHPAAIDLDFGNFRSAFKVPKEREHILFNAYQRLAKYYFKDGYDVLTNEPSLIPLLKQFAEGHIFMYLPYSKAGLVQRVKEREAKRHVNADFPIALSQHIDEWVNDWEKIAQKYNIPVFYQEYFKEGKINYENRKLRFDGSISVAESKN